jgi:hypothetical protein
MPTAEAQRGAAMDDRQQYGAEPQRAAQRVAAEALAEVWEWDLPVGFTGAERLRLAFMRRLYRCGRLTEFTPGS